ncbi:MAG: extracellular solute-binding protein [Clostridia bacterium]|nr:extracellular solute-binding protein [Clostridia bacterium]
MKNLMKLLCLALCIVMLLPLVVSCGKEQPKDTTNAGGNSVETNELGEEIPAVPTVKYDGYEYTVYMTDRNNDAVLVRDFQMSEEEATLNVLNEALYKRNQQMQAEFDIVINPIVEYASNNTGTQKIRQANQANTHTYDLCIIGTASVSNLAMSGDLKDLNAYGEIYLTKSWWDQNINRDLAVNGKVFYTTGDISLVATQAMYGLMFNKEMFDEYDLEYPYQLVKEGKWTFDQMKQMALKVSDDLDANDKMDAYDKYGFGWINSTCVAFLNAAGERVAEVGADGQIKLTVTSERAANAVIGYIEFINDKAHSFNGQKGTSGLTDKTAIGMFADGQLLFRAGEHLCFPHLRDTELNYGILPLPKYDEAQESYHTPVGSWDGAYVCVPKSTENEERTSTIIERTAYISSQIVTPAYYERTLEGKYIRDEDSYDMISIEIKNRMYDIGLMFDFGGMQTSITSLATNGRTQFASMLRSIQSLAEKAISDTNAEFAAHTNE